MSLAEKLALFDPRLPLEQARTIPSLWYFDHEIYDAERQKVFGSTWQYVGRVDQFHEPGSYLTTDIAGESVIILRDQQHQLRAMSNVCRHKAATILTKDCGKTDRLRCTYHGWTYDLCGALLGTPEFDGVENFSKDQHPLPSFAVDSCGPLVFVHLGKSQMPLAEYLAPFSSLHADSPVQRLKYVCSRDYILDCNWKVFVDNYQDGGYHVNSVHPGLAGALDYKEYRIENFPYATLQSSPIKSSDDPTIREVRSGQRAGYWWFFPNLMVNIYDNVMDVNLVLPLGPERCRVIFDFFFELDAPESFISSSIDVANEIQLEDMQVCQQVQQGLRSRTYDTGRFSVKREKGCYHFHKLLAQHLNAED